VATETSGREPYVAIRTNWIRKNGLPATRRGAGKPARPPTVWTKRTRGLPDLGIRTQNLERNPGNDHVLDAETARRRANEASTLLAVADDPSLLDLDPPLSWLASRKRSASRNRSRSPSSKRSGGGSS
jgi:hypothetical protein